MPNSSKNMPHSISLPNNMITPYTNDPLLHLLPPVRRTREYWIYTTDDKRILDLYQDNGRAIFGHRPHRLTRTLKQRLEQGLYDSLPSKYERQLITYARPLYPHHPHIFIYATWDRAIHAIKHAHAQIEPSFTLNIGDPACEDTADYPVALARPLLPLPNTPILLPVLPFPGGFAPQLVCIPQTAEQIAHAMPANDIISPVLLCGAIQSLKNIRIGYRFKNLNRSDIIDPAKEQFNLPLWKRRGLYLTPQCPHAHYAAIFKRFLSGAILINPTPHVSILPARMMRAEYRRFIEISTEFSALAGE